MGYADVRTERGEVDQLSDPSGAQADEASKTGQVAYSPQSSYITLDIGFEVVAERLMRIKPLVQDTGIESRVENLIHFITCSGLMAFSQRERQQAEQCSPAGQRLVDGIGEPELLATRKHEKPVATPLVGQYLKVGQKRGDTLDLIDDGSRAELPEKASWIRFGKIPYVGRFEIGIFEIWKSDTTKRRLAGLSWSGYSHKGILLEQFD